MDWIGLEGKLRYLFAFRMYSTLHDTTPRSGLCMSTRLMIDMIRRPPLRSDCQGCFVTDMQFSTDFDE